jgi:hypothetical protein
MKEKTDREFQIAEILYCLKEYWEKHPYLRLCQIVSNAWQSHPDYKRDPEPDIQDIFYFTDKKFIEGLNILSKSDESKDQGPTQK